MAIKESNKKAKANYKRKIEIIRIELYPTDEDIKKQILDRVTIGEPKTTYIKRLIREDIKKPRN